MTKRLHENMILQALSIKKFKHIENVWKPHKDFEFPTSEFINQEVVTKSYCCKWIWLKIELG